ncbi:unnamed protein product [Paramecium primaurelia]|uniref:PAS domain-containing protein n=1 Tax=Paramecium primaurelia TaxID=5886 RepID=A0A8S1NHT5_PARPR|nr:unnamed protein product [Paramecium primaurelia]
MNNRRVFYDESIWERFENRIKTWTYGLTHELLQNQVCSPFLFKFLILIELIQLLYYSIHPNLDFLFKTVWLEYFRNALQYFQVNYIIFNGGVNVLLIVMYISFGVQILMLLLLVIITFKLTSNKRKPSTFLTYCLKIFSLYGLLLNTILTIPIFNSFIATIFCNSDAPFSDGLECYAGLHFLHISLAIIGLILFLINVLYFGLLYAELNPSSPIPFASPQSKTQLVRQLIKIILPLYVTLDFNGEIAEVYISLLAAFYLLLLVQRYRSPPYYNKSVYGFIVVQEVLLFWASLVGVITAFLDLGAVDDIGLFYMILGMPLISLVYFQLLTFRQQQLLKTPIKSFKKETDIEIYINHLMDLIENREILQSRIILEGVLKLHLKNCGKPSENCVCQQLVADNLKDEETPQKLKRWYQLIKSIISDALDRYPKCPRLHLLNSYIHHEKLKNKFKALFELMITEENKPNLQEEFSIYRYKNLIEEEMIENDMRTSENKGVDVNIIVVFQNKFVNFLSSIEKSVTLHMEFWRELLEENPDIQKLQSLGSKITNTVESTSDFYKKLQEMNQNHIKCLQVYGNFLKDIVNDDVEGQRILEKAEYIQKSTAVNKLGLDQERQKYGENANTCIITCSGNYNNIGVVTNVNNEITRILGFSKSDIIGQNVNRIMPKVYADQHDQFMKNYLETSDSKVIGQERILLAQNKNNYLVPCTLMIKVLPNLDEGIQIVGFLKDIEPGSSYLRSEQEIDQEWHFIIINVNSQAILGITQSCYTRYGIPASLVYGNSTNTNEFTIDAIAPELVDIKNQDDLKSQGLVTTIDTSQLQQNFLLGRGESDDEMSLEEEENIYEPAQQVSQMQSKIGDSNLGQMLNQNHQYKETAVDLSQQVQNSKIEEAKSKKLQKQQRYKKYKIKAFVQDETEFGDQKIQIIRFYEVDENEEIKQQRSMEPAAEEAQQNQMKTVMKDEQQVQEDVNASEGESNLSGGSVNDDMRQLKDFKALISEKTEPKYIRILKRTVWFIMLLLIVLSALILGYRMSQSSDVQEGADAIYLSYMRHNIMADVNFYTRLLQMLGNSTYIADKHGYTTTTADTFIKANLSYLVDTLKVVQFDVIKARIKMEARMTGSSNLETYQVKFLLTSGEEKTYDNIFNDALFQIITSASSLRNSSAASFNGSVTTVDNTQKNFFYVMTNGLFVLRKGSENIAQRFFDFYSEEINDYQVTFFVIMGVGIFCLVVSAMILIPIVFQVHKTNNMVMSLFGIIPIQEIKELAAKCENYMQEFLEDKNEKKEMVDKEDKPPQPSVQPPEVEKTQNKDVFEMNNEEEDRSDKKKTQQQNGSNGSGQNVLQTGQPNSNAIHTSITAKPTENKATPSAFTQGATKNDQKQQQQQEQDKKENEEEIENLRSQKLLNSKDNNKSVVIVQFLIFALIFIAYFILDINLELIFLDNVQKVYDHLQYSSKRPISIKYNVYFTFEEVVTNKTQLEDSLDMRTEFQSKLYDNERNLFQSLTQSFPSQFDSYLSKFQAFTYNNLCTNDFSINNFVTDQTGCANVDSGLLTSGLKTAFVSVALSTNDMISYWKNTERTRIDLISTINNQTYHNKLHRLLYYISPACDYLTDQFMSGITDFLSYSDSIEQMKFSVYLVLMFAAFIFCWTPYLNNLSKQIWRTKGMLNMIPMDIIQKYPNLKQQFIGGEILQAVK